MNGLSFTERVGLRLKLTWWSLGVTMDIWNSVLLISILFLNLRTSGALYSIYLEGATETELVKKISLCCASYLITGAVVGQIIRETRAYYLVLVDEFSLHLQRLLTKK